MGHVICYRLGKCFANAAFRAHLLSIFQMCNILKIFKHSHLGLFLEDIKKYVQQISIKFPLKLFVKLGNFYLVASVPPPSPSPSLPPVGWVGLDTFLKIQHSTPEI